MHCGLRQLLLIRHTSGGRVVACGRAAIMPDTENSAHHHVHLAAGLGVQLLGIAEKEDELFIHGDRLPACQPVYRTQIVDSGIFMIYIKELVILFQYT